MGTNSDFDPPTGRHASLNPRKPLNCDCAHPHIAVGEGRQRDINSPFVPDTLTPSTNFYEVYEPWLGVSTVYQSPDPLFEFLGYFWDRTVSLTETTVTTVYEVTSTAVILVLSATNKPKHVQAEMHEIYA
jgi:hypothetical protein